MLLSENDDEKEKENLRQQNTNVAFTPFSKMLAGDVTKKRESFNAGDVLSGTPKGGRLDPERLQSMYGDCIKLANENKITQKNAWNMNLLDHIRGLAAGSETDFVTAGCTLDAAGKIYSCRVDSAHTETFRVVTGWSRTTQPQEGEKDDQAAEDDKEGNSDAENEADDDEGKSKKKERKKAACSTTLEANPDNLIQKKVEAEHAPDPLFQRMCQAFDEGGARGMLLNQLAVAQGCRLLIDSTIVCDDDCVRVGCTKENRAVQHDTVDLTDLRADLLRALGVAEAREAARALQQRCASRASPAVARAPSKRLPPTHPHGHPLQPPRPACASAGGVQGSCR
jgi:condensin complex subunit 2